MSRRLVARAGVLVAAALVASGCGSDGSDATDETQQIPAEVADDLAAQSDAVEATLVQEGEGCKARDQAITLRKSVSQAIKEGDVPADLQREMRGRAKDLVESIHCEPPQPSPPPPPPPPTDYEEEEDD